MKQAITAANAPNAIGPYSQGIQTNNLIFTSGQLPIDTKTGQMPPTAAEQAQVSLQNCKYILEAADAGLEQVVKVMVFLKNMEDFAAVNKVYETFFSEPFPARSCVEVARLPKDALIEIECIAMK